MPGLRSPFGSVASTDAGRLPALQRSTSSSRSRTSARFPAKRHNSVNEFPYDVAGVPICSTSGRDVVLAKSALHALDRLQRPQPSTTHSATTPAVHDSTNHSIKMAAKWQDIQLLLGTVSASTVTASNVTYALFRLGCMYCLAAPQRQIQIKESGVLEHLFSLAHDKLPSCTAPEFTHMMDACARLRYKPAGHILDAVAVRCQQEAFAFTAHQLPLLLWGFASVAYKPVNAVQQVLNQAVQQHAAQFSPQGVSLTLWAYASLHHVPAEGVLQALVANWEQNVAAFKPHELANCLESCTVLSYNPGHAVKAAIASRMGRSQTARNDTVLERGKPSLTPGVKPISVAALPAASSGLNRFLAKAKVRV